MQLRSKPKPNIARPAGTARDAAPASGVAYHRGSETERITLPPIADPSSRRAPQPTIGGPRELAEQLDGMAGLLGEVDPRSAERLGDLARSIGTEEGRVRWADVDLRRAFNTERLAHAYAVRREGGYEMPAVEAADKIRNVFILFPILLTWLAFSEASKAYREYIDRHPEEVRTPMILLWQRGFGGEASVLAPTFSTVALIAALLIGVIVALTIYAQGQREKREEAILATAGAFQSDLDNVLGEATVALAGDRAGRPALLVRSLERLSERFDRGSQELLTRLRIEHYRLAAIGDRREEEFKDFGFFTSGMRAGAEESRKLLAELRQVSTGLHQAMEDITSEIGLAGEQQQTLVSAIGNLERLVASGIQSDQAVARQLGDAAGSLADAADKALFGADAAAQAGRVATEAVRGIAELTASLASSQERVGMAVASEAESNSRLADAFLDGTDGVAASTRALNEIGAGLAQLQQEFRRLGDHTARQTNTLSAILAEQGEVATALTEAARELEARSVLIEKRQGDVSRDLSTLLGRLDGLATTLAKATDGGGRGERMAPAPSRFDRSGDDRGPLPVAPAPIRPESSGTGELGARKDRTLWPRNTPRPGSS